MPRKSNYTTFEPYELRRENFLNEAEGNHMLRRSGVTTPLFLLLFGQRAAGWFGRLLVSLGRRLEQLECAGQSTC